MIGLLGVVWNVVTFFVTRVLLYEDLGAVEAIKRSAQLFRQRWGEQFVGGATIGLAMFLLGIPVALVGALLVAVSPVLGGALLVIAIGARAALSGVFNAALYRFAASGQAPGSFSPDDLNATFRPRRNRGGLGGGSMGLPGGFTG